VKHKAVFVFILFFLILLFPSFIYAQRGCCSGHDGVCCECGAQANGKVICNDGWRGSSCLYANIEECRNYEVVQPVSTTVQQDQPTQSPTIVPTLIPTVVPTNIPVSPTIEPTQIPTEIPTPTIKPTDIPKELEENEQLSEAEYDNEELESQTSGGG